MSTGGSSASDPPETTEGQIEGDTDGRLLFLPDDGYRQNGKTFVQWTLRAAGGNNEAASGAAALLSRDNKSLAGEVVPAALVMKGSFLC